MIVLLVLAASSAACGSDPETTGALASGSGGNASSTSASSSGGSASGGAGGQGGIGGGGGAACVIVDDTTDVVVAIALRAGEYALELPATSTSSTSWRELGNEALVLDVSTDSRPIGQLVLHQGADGHRYGMSLGHLEAGEPVRARVSGLSAAGATPSACVGPATLTEAAELGDLGEGLTNAPIFRWPVAKRFDDLPVMLGWSKAGKHYQAYYTSENGGTVQICGGGADGMQAELARWGRGADVERVFNYGGATPTWQRCTGTVGFDVIEPRTEALHPIFYYGDGHNRLFEDRGGYGQTCGTSGDNQADGDLDGWNVGSPGDAEPLDDGRVITLRPLPVSLDSLGYVAQPGRREGAIDTYAPWLYRVTDAELAREGKIDGAKVQPMQNYLFVDIHANDVGGSGDSYCSLNVGGGFRLRVVLGGGGTVDGPQMTADYFGGQDAIKRIAIPLGEAYEPDDLAAIVFDAYDDDGMYFLDLGDAFIPRPAGDNGATIGFMHMGVSAVNEYVDDDSSGCTNGMSLDGPSPPYPCVGGSTSVALP